MNIESLKQQWAAMPLSQLKLEKRRLESEIGRKERDLRAAEYALESLQSAIAEVDYHCSELKLCKQRLKEAEKVAYGFIP